MGGEKEHPHHGIGMLGHAVQNHVESFNAFLNHYLENIVDDLPVYNLQDPQHADSEFTFFIEELTVSKPVRKPNEKKKRNAEQIQPEEMELNRAWLPSDCRMAHSTYSGSLVAQMHVSYDGTAVSMNVDLGDIPIMVRSAKCNLHGMSSKELVEAREDCTESGGYFLLHGLERVIRLLIMPRANFPMAVVRGSYTNRGKLYTDKAVVMRCLRRDGTSQTNCLHYLKDGSCTLRFSVGREEWLIPLSVVCHCVCSVSDRYLIELLAGGSVQDAEAGDEPGGNQELWDQVVVMIQQQNKKHSISKQLDAQRYLGQIFRVVVGNSLSPSAKDEEVGKYMADRFFMVHTEDPWQKLLSLSIMFQKLMGLVQGHIQEDNQDTMSSHEVLHPGQLYGMVLKEALDVSMLQTRAYIKKTCDPNSRGRKLSLVEYVTDKEVFRKAFAQSCDVQKRLENFLATGNVTSRSGLDLLQTSGFTVVADKLNQARYSSHFAAVHRGQYFAEMKTTTVRKLLPETWGFLCPVHTPDGSPCGLLNHLAHSCKPVVTPASEQEISSVLQVLYSLGAQLWQSGTGTPPETRSKHAWVLLDGRPVAFFERTRLHFAAEHLRNLKVQQKQGIPKTMEIVLATRSWGKLFTGLFLFLGCGRVIRPVRNLRFGTTEWIGPMEQLFLNVSVLRAEKRAADQILDGEKHLDELPEQLPLRFTHEELKPTELFSTLAALTPFSNHNQSPRNMYQCQMLKQTMATPYHNHDWRPDNKVFRVWCPQSPLVRTEMYDTVHCDEHPIGTNAVVAVITYTGYDMEDAMIINKQSYERGFGHGVVYKTKIIDACDPHADAAEMLRATFSNIKMKGGEFVGRMCEELNDDGFPPIGTYLTKDSPMYCVMDAFGKSTIHKYKDDEPCYVEQVVRLHGGDFAGCDPFRKVLMKLRYTRNPVVGDKFSSRHGQKGVMSILWPAEDMPWTESGLTPDILFNPHGFPSRMTIGMLIESIAGKTAAMEAKSTADATTFREYKGFYNNGDNEGKPFLEKSMDGPRAAEYFGETLKKHGYKRLGTERMYSGIHGTEIETDIFVGVVYYQRLRHLVMDKAQVRARGKTDRLTNQPLKGRKNKGGIRFGEMERDSLLAHGTSFLLHDRLMRSSDFDMAYVCPSCGSVVTPTKNAGGEVMEKQGRSRHTDPGEAWECKPCSLKQQKIVKCHSMPVPWVFRYLACELASMNVKMDIKVSEKGREMSCSSGKYTGDAVK